MSITERIRARITSVLTAEMQRVNRELQAQAPIPDGTGPPLEELLRVLADLQKQQSRRPPYLRAPAARAS